MKNDVTIYTLRNLYVQRLLLMASARRAGVDTDRIGDEADTITYENIEKFSYVSTSEMISRINARYKAGDYQGWLELHLPIASRAKPGDLATTRRAGRLLAKAWDHVIKMGRPLSREAMVEFVNLAFRDAIAARDQKRGRPLS